MQAGKSDSVYGATSYVYDGMGRLKQETAPDYAFIYAYDAAGNRTGKTDTVSGMQTAYTYDANNRLLSESATLGESTQVTNYSYDPNGNLFAKMQETYAPASNNTNESLGLEAPGQCVELFMYDLFGCMTGAIANGHAASYTYNADGLRTSKTVDGVTTTHIWDGANMVAEVDNTGIIGKYYRGNGLIKQTANGTDSYYQFDGHGDTVQLTSASGTVTRDYRYDAFGSQLQEDETDANPFRYCGEYWDVETGNIYLRARYYEPGVGRFVSEDTHWNTGNMIFGDKPGENPVRDISAIMQSGNLYGYCRNNPILFIDPFGMYSLAKDSDGQVYAIIEKGDTLSGISYAEVRDSTAYLKLNYENPGELFVGQYVNITGIYNENYPVPTNIALSKTSHTQGDSGLRDVSDEEISARARDKSLSGEERRRYQREEKLRGNRNKQKRASNSTIQQPSEQKRKFGVHIDLDDQKRSNSMPFENPFMPFPVLPPMVIPVP